MYDPGYYSVRTSSWFSNSVLSVASAAPFNAITVGRLFRAGSNERSCGCSLRRVKGRRRPAGWKMIDQPYLVARVASMAQSVQCVGCGLQHSPACTAVAAAAADGALSRDYNPHLNRLECRAGSQSCCRMRSAPARKADAQSLRQREACTDIDRSPPASCEHARIHVMSTDGWRTHIGSGTLRCREEHLR